MKKITIVGGDDRLRIVKDELQKSGFPVDTLGLFEGDSGDLQSSQAILLPVPVTKDGLNVYCPLTKREILLTDILEQAGNRLLLCGNFRFEGKNCVDYCASDAYALRNAVPTAEGAIKIAMERTPYTLWGSRVLVVGYGRVGKVLCDRLCGLRCDVTVSARKPADFALLDTLGIKHIHTGSLPVAASEFDIIFNTVDAPVLNDALVGLSKTLLIDLSSKGGFDLRTAEALGIDCCKVPGLPGKVAPETAGKILAGTVLELIRQNT